MIGWEWDFDDLDDYIEHLRSEPISNTARAVRDGMVILAQQMNKNVSGEPVAYEGRTFTVQKRTGNLARGIDFEFPYEGDCLKGRIWYEAINAGVNYADFLIKGGEIRVKNARAFAIIVLANGELKFLDRTTFPMYVQAIQGPPKQYVVTGGGGRKTKKGMVDYYEGGEKKWVSVIGGELIFRKKVHIGPHPFVQAAWAVKKDEIVEQISQAFIEDLTGRT